MAEEYRRYWLWPDVLSVTPLDLIPLALGESPRINVKCEIKKLV